LKKILFFDDFLIHRQDSIVRRFHTPVWLDDSIYADTGTGYGVGYSSVVPAIGGGYYLYYITLLDEKSGDGHQLSVLRRARSDDGLSWAPEDGGRSANPQVREILGSSSYPAGCCAYRDETDPDPERRFKMTTSPVHHTAEGLEALPSFLLASPDGLIWHRIAGDYLPHHGDTFHSLLHNPVTGKYQITLRRRWGERRICLVESADLATWSEPRAVVHPDSSDLPSTHFYGMPQFYLESAELFVGFLWNQHMPYNEVMGGPVQSEYSYSYDGLMWNRTRHLSMGLRERGAYGGGSMYAAAMVETDGDIIVYSVARLEEHHRVSNGVLLPGRLRKDGFVSLDNSFGRGEITTECLLLNLPELSLNVNAPFGRVRAQLCDPDYNPVPGYGYADSDEIRGNHLSRRLAWNRKTNLSEMIQAKRWVRLQIQMEQAELYSIQGDFATAININAPVYQRL
jgi:hypothetical protein